MEEKQFNELAESVREGMDIISGKKQPSRVFHFSSLDIQKIRKQYNLSQQKFARLMGISVNTLQNWEQGRRKPTGTARVLLEVAANHPDALLDTLKKADAQSDK